MTYLQCLGPSLKGTYDTANNEDAQLSRIVPSLSFVLCQPIFQKHIINHP